MLLSQKLKNMALRGELPKRLLNVQNPFCAACQYGKLTKRAWRTKEKQSNTFESTYAGQIVSVDQMESPTAGFIVQLKGKLLQDTDEGRNKSNDNPVNPARGTETSSGACISARRTSISTDITSNSNQDGVSSDTHTGPTPSH